VAYKLQLPAKVKIQNVFHISILKLFKGNHHDQYLPLPLQTIVEGPVFIPHSIVGTRTVIQQGKEIPQVLVQWGPNQHLIDLGKMLSNFQQIFSSFNLEGKVGLEGEANVTTPRVTRGTNINNEGLSNKRLTDYERVKVAPDLQYNGPRRSQGKLATNRRLEGYT